MSGRTKPDHEVIFSMEVDRYLEFVDQAVIVASADSRPVVRPPGERRDPDRRSGRDDGVHRESKRGR